MGCFLACFGSSKDRNRKRRHRHKILPGDPRHGSYEPLKPALSLNQESKETLISSVLEQRNIKPEEQLSFSTRKKVTFDLNVKTYENISAPETTNYSWENDEEIERCKQEEKRAKLSLLPASEDDSVTSSLGSYPPNHRYQNCWDSNDEEENIDFSESDLDDDDDDDEDDGYYDEEDDEPREYKADSSESSLSSPIESQTQGRATPLNDKEVDRSMPICGSPEGELKTLPLNQNARDRSKYVHSVLNPVENLSQWKAVKAKPRAATAQLQNQKENGNFEQETQIPFNPELTFKLSLLQSSQSFNQFRPKKQETAVDASLSNWLVNAETTPAMDLNSSSSCKGIPNTATSKYREVSVK
ncbi:probable serine/threonine-protein kinase fhkB [Telopea speciosissima]|uniref:probable serine/threonine-protein kinase fhkB n=1 Tax=Telopea speciosissima TaxID=54955 RepID=UPI001CC557FE|nr:probable serine/threonine-protein kinase fhkB [Telopea speciosissima]